jgi:hypothetical protein
LQNFPAVATSTDFLRREKISGKNFAEQRTSSSVGAQMTVNLPVRKEVIFRDRAFSWEISQRVPALVVSNVPATQQKEYMFPRL